VCAATPTVPAARRKHHQAPRSLRLKRLVGRTFLYLGVLLVVAVMFFPIYWMAVSSVQPLHYALHFPPPFYPRGFNWQTYRDLFNGRPIGTWIWNSTELALMCTAITLVLATLGAYAMSRLQWRGKLLFGFMLLLTQMMPGAVIIVPVLKIFRDTSLNEHLWAVALLQAAFILPIGVWILMRLFSALPEDVLDAARVDGSGELGVLLRVVMPLSTPGLVAVAVVAFFFSWNEYLFASTLITDPNSIPASVGIATLISQLDSPVQQLLAAGLLFSILPVLFYIAVQRLIVAGLTAGAVKG
jgi:multiple sugar transport system permease protein